MANKFQIKRTSNSGVTPNTTNASNTAYIAPGELAINMADSKLFTANASGGLLELGSNLTNLSVTGTTTVKAISANGSIGTAGQMLTSNGTSTYWLTPQLGDITSVTSGNGLSGGGTTGDVTLNVGAGVGITVNADDVAVNPGGGLTANSTGVHVGAGTGIVVNADDIAVNATYIASVTVLSANNADYLDGQHGAYYTNASNLSTGTVPYARIPANIANTTADFTFSGIHTHSANIVVSSTAGLSANGFYGSPGHVLHSNGTSIYWDLDDNVNTTYDLTTVANTSANAGRIRLTDSNTANDDVLIIGSGTTTVSSNSSGIYVNSADQYVGTVTSVTGGSGLTGSITTSGSLAVGAGVGITVNADDVAVNPGGGLTANSTGVHVGQGTGIVVNADDIAVNASYIATLSVNSAAQLTTARTIGDVSFNGTANIVPERINYKDTRANNYSPYSYSGITLHLKTNSTDGLSDGATYHGVLDLMHWSDASGGSNHQLGFTDNGNAWIRYSTNSTTWSSWSQLISSTSGTANNSTNLNGQAAGYYTNASNITTGTLPYAQIPANVTNTTANFSISGAWTFNSNVTLGAADHLILSSTSGISANGTYGTAGQVLHSNGTAVYWGPDDDINTTYDLLAVANTASNQGIIRLKDSSNANDDVLITGTGATTVSSNATHIVINSNDTDTTYNLKNIANTVANEARIQLYPVDDPASNTTAKFVGGGTTTVSSNTTALLISSADQYTGTVTSVTGGAGLTGSVSTSGSLAVGQGTGIIVNADDVAVNASYIATIASNSATYANSSVSNTFTVGTASYFVANGNLGIGDTDPGEKLDVRGNLRVGGADAGPNYIAFRGTTADGAGSYNHTYVGERIHTATEGSELLIFKGNDPAVSGPDRVRIAAAEFRVDTYSGAISGGFETVASNTTTITNKFIVTNDGNVGIGTTTPGSKLDVYGTSTTDIFHVRNGTTYFTAGVTDGTKVELNSYQTAVGAKLLVIQSAGGITNFGGNVGIGTDSPAAKLDLGTASATNQIQAVLARQTTGGDNNFRLVAKTGSGVAVDSEFFKLGITYTDTDNAFINFYRGGSTTGGFLTFSTNNNTERMRIRSDGNVGIGTTTPQYKFDVNSGAGSANSIQASFGSTIIAGYWSGIHFGYSEAANQSYRKSAIVFERQDSAARGKIHILNNDVSGSASATLADSKMTIQYDGNVGIGTTSPGYKLEVNGSFAATTKSFLIDHPTKEGMKLRYGSLEGPENGVYVRGRLKDSNVIELPDYWTGLVDEGTITVNLTAIGKSQDLWVEDIADNKVVIGGENINCFYTVFAERKDVEKLKVEF